MAWISRNGALNQSEMENNADIVINYLRTQGVNDNTIAAILGNMQAESTVNPGRYEGGVGPGYGLVQWTPQSDLINACSTLGISPYSSGDVQLEVLINEIKGTPSSINQWYSTSAFISNYYNSGATSDMVGITGQQFLSNSMNWSADKLAVLFMAAYERPSYDPNVNHYTQRQQNATNWLSYMGVGSFTPRLDDNGIVGDFHYYSQNPLYLAGYGMPNCTCYAWGRFWEIGDPTDTGANKPTHLPTSNGGQWFGQAQSEGYYETGQTPKLGAVICFSDNNGGAGHVAIVEEINSDGTLTCSNSAWQGQFFFLSTVGNGQGSYNWSHFTCQGFIYNPYAISPIPPTPPTPTSTKKHHYKFVLFNRRKRARRHF